MDQQKLVQLGEVYQQLSRRVSQEWGKHLEQGMSHSQASILKILKSSGRLKISDLAERMAMTSGAITALSDKLISGGYANRVRSEEDRRVVYLEITSEGTEIIKSIRAQKWEIFNHLFEGVPEEDINHLIRIYQKIIINIEK